MEIDSCAGPTPYQSSARLNTRSNSAIVRWSNVASIAGFYGPALHQGNTQTERLDTVKNGVGKFTFKVPEGHAQAGETIEKGFEFPICETEAEALKVIEDRKWSVLSMVNDNLKGSARSNAYQAALLPYRPSEVSPEDIKERMVRDYIRLGIPEDTARKQVEALLAATQAQG